MADRAAPKGLGGTLLLVGVTAVWGWTFTVVRDAVAVFPVLGFLAIRFTIASVALSPVSLRRMSARTLRTGLAIGVVLGVGYFFQTLGLRYTTPTNSGLVTGLFLLFVPLFDRLLHGVRLRRLLWAEVAVCFVGMALLVGEGRAELRIGDALTVVAAAAYGLHIALLSRHAREHDPAALTMGQMLAVAVGAAAAWPLLEPLSLPPAPVWVALLITGVLASGVAFYVQTFVQSRLSALRAGIIIATEPLFAAVFGYLLAGDRLSASQLRGGMLLLGAIVTCQFVPAWQNVRARGDAAPPPANPPGTAPGAGLH